MITKTTHSSTNKRVFSDNLSIAKMTTLVLVKMLVLGEFIVALK